jgi:hypothetical protein
MGGWASQSAQAITNEQKSSSLTRRIFRPVLLTPANANIAALASALPTVWVEIGDAAMGYVPGYPYFKVVTLS